MAKLHELKHALSSHRRKVLQFPPETKVEREIEKLNGLRIQIQIEAEELRKSFRLSLYHCELYEKKTETGPVYKFTFQWENVRDDFEKSISLKEKTMMETIDAKLKALHEQPATTGAN